MPGAALALGAVASAIAALPAVRRVAGSDVSPGLAWVALSGGTALVLGPLLACTRAIHRDSPALRAVLKGIALASAPLAVLGKVLKVETHHRPLGAATFSFLSFVLVLGCILLAVRVAAWARAPSTPLRRALDTTLTVTAGVSLALVLLRGFGAHTLAPDVTDGVRVLLVAALAHRALDLPTIETLARRAGVLAWVVIVAAGLVAARGQVRVAVHERAPVLGGPMAWL
jgi:hypothetical protein